MTHSPSSGKTSPAQPHDSTKSRQLDENRSRPDREALRTNQGVRMADNQNTLRGGMRGPSLLEDFIMREKITHFDHERIPERVVHARGSAAHAVPTIVAPTLAPIGSIVPQATLAGMPSVMFDAVFVCGGDGDGRDLAHGADARHFVREAFKHLKPVAAVGAGRQLLSAAHLPDPAEGVCVGQAVDFDAVLNELSDHVGRHRVWAREQQAAEWPA